MKKIKTKANNLTKANMKQTHRLLTVLYIGHSEPGTNEEGVASFFTFFQGGGRVYHIWLKFT